MQKNAACETNNELLIANPAWRRGLVEELLRRQRADGSWHHESADWWENRPELATAYALLALELALP